jgi:arylsulfatase A-like enzyme
MPPSTNLVFISIDCLNRRQFETAMRSGWAPGIAALAKDSLDFSRAYSHAPWTTPSHMSMLSGLYPSQHGRNVPWVLMQKTHDWDDRVAAYDTLADRLGAVGYATVGFVGKGSISAAFGVGKGFQRYEEFDRASGSDLPRLDAAMQRWLSEELRPPFFLFLPHL